MHRAILFSATLAALAVAAPPAAGAAEYVPGELIVKYRDGVSAQKLEVEGESVRSAVRRLRSDPSVAYAVPNFVARASGFVPNDPGFRMQWNFRGLEGINMPEAWDLAAAAGAPGGRGAVIAVLDTGVAYQRFRQFRRAPDLDRFVPGHDFVGHDDHPNDENGHGTHVSGTIAQSTGNRIGAAGIAYRARIMPVRVLDDEGAGNTVAISRGIRYAARHGADVINLSLEFDGSIRAAQIPDIVSALRYARAKGALVVAAAGNQAANEVAFPARSRYAVAVAATTIHGCRAIYSNTGAHVDIAAPGGGQDAYGTTSYEDPRCSPERPGKDIYQQTFKKGPARSLTTFGLPSGYEGTSMAAPHVSGVAALLIASKRLGENPPAWRVARRLRRTARDIGPPGWDPLYGAGLLDAAAALR